MPRDFFHGRHAGLLVPLFSIPSRASWGIGEIGDLPRLGEWMTSAGFSFVQLLPINEMADGQNSPYSAMSAMAIDPIFISPSAVPDLVALGGEGVLNAEERAGLEAARKRPAVDYATVRAVKIRALRAAFERFRTAEWETGGPRARRLKLFLDRARWWLDDYTLFRALHAREDGRYWREWPEPLRDRRPAALTEARRELAGEILFHAYLQWVAADQWAEARDACGVGVFGDFPFMVSGDSADVWGRQQDFNLDASVGAPPDAFSETGQDWGFPAYRWKAIAAGGFRWLAARARRSAELYDGYRVDHLVGFFRTYVRQKNGEASFVPPDKPDQIVQGERVLDVLSATGARIIAEDLGVIPGFVRETVAQWWDEAPITERRAVAAIVCLDPPGCDPEAPFNAAVRDSIVQILYASASDIVLLPIHDVFGWRDRVNTPAVIDAQNWTWRLPWPVEDLGQEAEGRDRA